MNDFIIGTIHEFNYYGISSSEADDPGVYVLFKDGEVAYIGESEEIKRRLLEHYNGQVNECSRTASRYCVRYNFNHKQLESDLIDLYRGRFGKKPPCHN